MKKKRANNAAKILFSWRKAMPFYYGIAWIIIVLIVFTK
jgi:hypothetical protein